MTTVSYVYIICNVSGQPALSHCTLQGFCHKTECLLNVGSATKEKIEPIQLYSFDSGLRISPSVF